MDARSDAFIALPGGFGTLEEIVEAITHKQLRYHDRPVVFLNTAGFYDPLLDFFDHQVSRQFVKAEHRRLYHVADTPEDAVDHVRHYAEVFESLVVVVCISEGDVSPLFLGYCHKLA
ncbi:MAG: TIGR00730 family Rossman fold protein [Proteobacteria bacterium]|nr:TIGR00730 family Rossman fold protein [Pseudomonadota bacterium]